jgi:hypothetical protein
VTVMDFNNKKSKEECEYVIRRSMFIYGVVYIKGFTSYYVGRLEKSIKVGLNRQDFIMAIYLYI